MSKQPRKMRKAFYTAPLHAKQKFLNAHLSRELRKQTRKRAVRVMKGDAVRIMKGRFKKASGKVVRVDVRRTAIFVEGIIARRARGEKEVFVPVRPSNVIITALAERKQKKKKASPAPAQAPQATQTPKAAQAAPAQAQAKAQVEKQAPKA